MSKGGGLPGFTTCLSRIPEKKHFVAVLGNSLLRSEKVAYDLNRMLLGMEVHFPEETPQKIKPQEYVGLFEEKENSGWYPFKLEKIDGILQERYSDGSSVPLIPQGKDTFIQPDNGHELRFLRNSQKEIIECHLTAGTWPGSTEYERKGKEK